MRLQTLIIFILLLMMSSQALAEILIKEVDISCSGSNECSERAEKLDGLQRPYPSINDLKKMLKLYMHDDSVHYFRYRVIELENKDLILKGNLILNKRVISIDTSAVQKIVAIPSVTNLRVDSFYDRKKEMKMIENLTSMVRSKGYPNAEVFVKRSMNKEGYRLKFKVKLGTPLILNEIRIFTENDFLTNICTRKLSRYKNKPFDSVSFKEALNELKDLFVSYGYYSLDFQLKTTKKEKNRLNASVVFNNTVLYSFYTVGNEFFKSSELKKKLKESIILLKRQQDSESVKFFIKELYWKKGFRDVEISIKPKEFKNSRGEICIQFWIHITENERYRIDKVTFKGNDFYTDKELKDMFFSMGDNDISYHYHNEDYYSDFRNILKNKYLENGFVNILIEKPQINFLKDSKTITIDYRLREVIRSQITTISLIGIDEQLQLDLLNLMVNKKQAYFNPLVFEEDLKNILKFLRNKGFYYAKIKTAQANELVKYNQDNSSVKIKIEIDLDKKYPINNLIIIGNYRTRSKLIKRESGFIEGGYLTESMMRRAQTNLLALGLFSRANISAIKMGDKVDIFIDLEEKDFGLIELAPGFRTDIGLKVSSKVSYINLDGMNKQIALSAIVNKRFNLNTLDERRRQEDQQLIEYEVNVNYSENKIFDSPVDYNTSFSTLRRRFYSFDANIERFNNTVSYNRNNWFSTSIKHQFETISQYDASLDREHGHFQIGSLTPGVTLDFRDNRINPLNGAYFSLTCEFANPFFLSQNTKELEINYYKLISRNKFYIPMGDVTFAISTSLGVQKNLAENKGESAGEKSGYIPNIKVFRLTGVDLVRGFADSEINRLVSGQDISEVRVDNTAYMANLKFEPRVFISDKTMFGVFYDAGRVFVNSYDFNDLRSSAGITFKYLTPVGSLDFDYGIKLLRKRDSSGRLESPGRLHVSIGFF